MTKSLQCASRALVAAAILTLATPGVLPAQQTISDSSAQSSFLSQLGGGGSVSFRTGSLPNGEAGWFHLGQDAATGAQVFEAEGSIQLETSDIDLKTRKLAYMMDSGLLQAREAVIFKTEDIEATCEALDYNRALGDVRLSGNPDVRQKTTANSVHFAGMDLFALRRGETGEQLVDLSGTKKIRIEMQGNGTAGETPASGLSSLGSNIVIEAAPVNGTEPRVRSIIAPGGALSVFTANGSVVMQSDQFNLRCDELIYNADDQRFEASGDVYLKQETIEADCGRMLYELDSGRITLTVRPDVRRSEAGGVTHITDYDVFIIEPRQDGEPDLRGIGDGRSFFTPAEAAKSSDTATEAPADTEIRLDQPNLLP